MGSKNKILTSIQRKKWSYEKGRMTLNFEIDVHNRTDLRDFLELLEVSVKDVKAEIHKNK